MRNPAPSNDSRLPPRPRKRPGKALRTRLAILGLLVPLACSGPSAPTLRPAPQSGRLSGRVLRIDRPNQEIELADTGRRYSVPYSARTIVRSAAASLGLTDIRVGDRVVVSFDHRARAKLITLIGPPRTPKAEDSAPGKKSPS